VKINSGIEAMNKVGRGGLARIKVRRMKEIKGRL
jgi:hypothetical protein